MATRPIALPSKHGRARGSLMRLAIRGCLKASGRGGGRLMRICASISVLPRWRLFIRVEVSAKAVVTAVKVGRRMLLSGVSLASSFTAGCIATVGRGLVSCRTEASRKMPLRGPTQVCPGHSSSPRRRRSSGRQKESPWSGTSKRSC